MSGEQKLNKFLEAMDSWLACKSLPLVDDNPQIKMILNMNSEEIRDYLVKNVLPMRMNYMRIQNMSRELEPKKKLF